MATLDAISNALEMERKAAQALRKRKSYCKQQEEGRNVGHKHIVQAAQEKCNALLEEGEHQCATILSAAKEDALVITNAAQAEASIIIRCARQEAGLLRQGAQEDLEKLEQRQRSIQDKIEEQKRAADAARKKARYWATDRGSFSSTLGKRVSTQSAGSTPDSLIPNRKLRSIRAVTTDIVQFFLHKVNAFNIPARKEVVSRLWLHSALRPYLPAMIRNPKQTLAIAVGLRDLTNTLGIVKTARRKGHLAVKRHVLSTMVGSATVSQRFQSALVAVLKIKRQNLHRVSKIRKDLDADLAKKYPMGERKEPSDKISDDVQKLVELYWETHTRISPCKDNLARKMLGRNDYDKHQVHWLEDTLYEFYQEFICWWAREQTGRCIRMRSFIYFKPYYIKKMKDCNVCCCKQHVEMDLLKEALNKFRKYEHSSECTCGYSTCRPIAEAGTPCIASRQLIASVRGWIEEALCP
ncbi:unnamed protein product [Calypogeia fissa]